MRGAAHRRAQVRGHPPPAPICPHGSHKTPQLQYPPIVAKFLPLLDAAVLCCHLLAGSLPARPSLLSLVFRFTSLAPTMAAGVSPICNHTAPGGEEGPTKKWLHTFRVPKGGAEAGAGTPAFFSHVFNRHQGVCVLAMRHSILSCLCLCSTSTHCTRSVALTTGARGGNVPEKQGTWVLRVANHSAKGGKKAGVVSRGTGGRKRSHRAGSGVRLPGDVVCCASLVCEAAA